MEGKDVVVEQVIKVSTLEWGWKLIFLGSFSCHYLGVTPWTILCFISIGYYFVNRPIPFMKGKKPQEVVSNALNWGYDLGVQGIAVLDVGGVALRKRLEPYIPLPPPLPGRKVD